MNKIAYQSNGTTQNLREPVRILHLEDSSLDVELIHEMIRREGLNCEFTDVSDGPKFEAVLIEQRFDLIICDYGIPGYDGFAALEFARSKQPETPVIMVSGNL